VIGLRLAGYCSINGIEAEQSSTTESQKELLKQYAFQHSHVLIEMYEDYYPNVTPLSDRQQFQRLMEDAWMGKFDAVIVKDLGRFSRESIEVQEYIHRLSGLGINILDISLGKIVTDNMFGNLLY
jgi:site-specific DNA recombinase